jgi:putative ABC transport system permease protein
MRWLARTARRVTFLGRRRALWLEMDDEMRQHLELEAADLERQGLSAAEARRRAMVAFGGVETMREAGWDARGISWLEDIGRDLRWACRSLRRAPAFTTMAVACMGLGIGATATIFGVVDGFLLRPLPYPDADRLVTIYSANAERQIADANISRPNWVAWRERNRSFSQLGMWTWSTLTFSGDGEPERVEAADVSQELFPLLGVEPILGRGFARGEDAPGRDRVLLLSHALWQRRFGGDPEVVGRGVTVDGLPYTVVGVMPPRFAFPAEGLAWRPLAGHPEHDAHGNRFYAAALGRLRPGVTLEAARADMLRVSADLEREHPDDNDGWETQLVSLRDSLVGDWRRPLLVLLGGVACVLLIACANVASLLLARGTGRRREIAVRAALGAGRGRVVRLLLAESVVLACLGGLAGGALALVGVPLAARAFPFELPFYLTVSVDAAVLACVAAAAGLTGMLAGVLPALRGGSLALAPALREGAAGSGESADRQRTRGVLVVAEIALSLVLMTGAGLLLRSYSSLANTDLGFAAQNVLTVRAALPSTGYEEDARRVAFFDQLIAGVAELPGVVAVGGARGAPFSGWDVQAGISVVGRPTRPAGEDTAHYQAVTPGFFRALGVPLRQGRLFDGRDTDPAAPVVVVNELFVKRFLAGREPLGAQVKIGGPDDPEPWATVIGVVGDFQQYRLPKPIDAALFYAQAQYPSYSQTLAIRASGDPRALVPGVQGVLRRLDPDVPAYDVATLDETIAKSLGRQRLQGQTLGLFAAVALLLAAVGLYGVIAYAVGQRGREIAVRVALGATRRQVVGQIVGQGARLALRGILIGLVVALVASRVLASLLHGVSANDPATFATVAALLALVALAASWLPARAASRVEPQVALRVE